MSGEDTCCCVVWCATTNCASKHFNPSNMLESIMLAYGMSMRIEMMPDFLTCVSR